MKTIVLLLVGFILGFQTNANELSLLPNTRLIYQAENKAQSFTVKVKSKLSYLLLTAVYNDKDLKILSKDFLIQPELTQVTETLNKTLTVRKIGNSFPKDRESLYYINGRFIPQKVRKDSKVGLAYSMTYKFIYRPQQLFGFDVIEGITNKITYSLKNGILNINNPTGYIINFAYLYLDKDEVELKDSDYMLMPFSSINVKVENKPYKRVFWSLINDFGGVIEPSSVKL